MERHGGETHGVCHRESVDASDTGGLRTQIVVVCRTPDQAINWMDKEDGKAAEIRQKTEGNTSTHDHTHVARSHALLGNIVEHMSHLQSMCAEMSSKDNFHEIPAIRHKTQWQA